MQLRTPLIAVSAAVVLGLAACGGDGGGSAEDDIADAVERGVVGRDVKVRCEEVTTSSFIRRVYGDVAQCRKAEKPESDDKPPTSVEVSQVKVDGERATAQVRYEGGDDDGAEGIFRLRKEEGDWRIDDLGVDLLRSQLEKDLGNGAQGSEGLRDPGVRRCAFKAFNDLPDARLKRVAYAAISERDSSQSEAVRVIAPCLSQAGSGTGSGSASFLREKFEQGVASSLRKDGTSPATIDCINGKLRTSITEAEIQGATTSGGRTTPQLTRKVADAIRACGGG